MIFMSGITSMADWPGFTAALDLEYWEGRLSAISLIMISTADPVSAWLL